MKTNTLTLWVIAAAFLLMAGTNLKAQNTIIPAPIQTYLPSFWNSDLFATKLPAFGLGHQWGAADLDKVNTALKMNVTSGNWGYLNDFAPELYKLGKGINDTNYIVWGAPLWWTPGPVGDVFRREWYGLRWEPAENPGLGRDWQPRDEDSWPFSFATRYHGTIPTSSTDVNYRRFKLDSASMASNPLRALDSVEPRNYLRMYRSVKWIAPMGERFADSTPVVVLGDTVSWNYSYFEDSTDARRLQLVVNLRRTNATDTILDDQPVVSIVVPYQMRWKDQVNTSADYEPRRLRMPFRLIPWNHKDSTFDLPLSRGLEMKMRVPPGGYSDSVIITRRMLPRHSDPGDPDITFVAEFRTDTIKGEDGIRREHMLKTGFFDYPAKNISDATLLASDNAAYNKRYRAIDSLGVTIWYHGNSPVAVRSASLLTPLTKNATSGHYDTAFASRFAIHRDSIRNELDTVAAHTGRTFRLLSFYTNDEFDLDQLLGMRYKLEYLDRRLTSETGFTGSRVTGDNFRTEYGKQKFHGWPSKFLWTSGVTHPNRATSVPYVARYGVNEWGYNTNTPVPAPMMSLKSGHRWADAGSPYRKYEADVSTSYYGSQIQLSLPFITTPNDYTTLAVYEAILHANAAQVGPAAMQENAAYVSMYQTGDWYFSKRRYFWSNFFYHTDPKYGFDSAGRPYVRYNNFQPLTGEAVRLGHGTSLNLGTRGFMYDKWKHQFESAPHPDSLSTPALYGKEGNDVFNGWYFPGYVTEDSTAFAWDTTATVTPDSLLKSHHLGGDYYTTTDKINIHDWTPLGTLGTEMQLNRFIKGDSSQKVYAGRLSVRMETKWWHDLVTDTATQGRRDTHLSNAAIFMKTRPIGWFGKGYRNLANGDSLRLRKWVDAYADSFKVHRWTRRSTTDTTLVLEAEPLAEHLYDVVLLDTSETSVSDDNCILAITNRRSSPFLFNTTLPDSIEWVSSYEHDTLTRGSRPDLRYKQVGARRITIPFNYSVVTSRPFLLHVRELRPFYDGAYTIDTIVSWNSDLAVDFRPGDTRYFQIKRLQAIDTLDQGYLAFSTQNKLVAYPVPKSDNSGYTDSIRYHMVFHRRDDDPFRNAWTVYYQRSKPYHRDSLPLVAGLDWENPIRLSGLTMSSVANTDGLNRTLYNNGVNTVAYLANVPNPSAASKDCCCGFPSIVIRETAANTPKVFVTYACEDEWATTNGQKQNYFHIVENAFMDQATLNPFVLDGNGKSLVIAAKNMGHDGGVDTLKSLSVYGTPVINASASNNMYYAWSSTAGISAGRKAGAQDWFPAANAITTLPQPTITWYYNHDDVIDTLTIAGGTPRYPSLNVYSNLAQNRMDATLVWQEGTTNKHIRYTRLIPGAGTAIARMLPDFIDMSYDTGTPPSIPVHAGNAIAIVGGASVDDEAELPVVVRSLQVDTMSMFIRDEDGTPNGLYRYNHETVSWSEYVLTDLRSRVRYNHFVDMQGFGTNELHYWWANTTYSMSHSLFHPVITNGKVWLDSLTWQGIVGDTLITYEDSLHIVKGNLSDSAIIVNYTLLNATDYADLQGQKNAGYASYWTGYRQFANLDGQQLLIRRMPGIPAPLDTIFDNTYLRASGAWPHVAMRQRENLPDGIQSVRRVLQYTNNDAPDLLASAEQFYKPSDMDTTTPPATYGGFEVRGQKLTTRAVLSDGRSVSFRPIYRNTIPPGYSGSAAYAWQMAAMTTPVTELVSEVFRVGDVDEMKLLSSGSLRNDVEVSIEEVNPATMVMESNGTSRFTDFEEPEETFTMTLAQVDEEHPEDAQRALYYLTSGEDQLYRLRLKYTGTKAIVFREDVDIAPEKESFEKAGNEPVRVVDLKRMKGTDLDASAGLRIYPNPASERVTILVGGTGMTPADTKGRMLVLDIADALGNVVLTSPVTFGEAVDVRGLPTGAYVVRVRLEGPYGATVRVSGSFTVVK